MKTTEKPEVKTYLDAIQGVSEFSELCAADLAKLAELEVHPDGWDWADHDGSRVIDAFWLNASEQNDQITLARICHLRALAWDAALSPYSEGQLPQSM